MLQIRAQQVEAFRLERRRRYLATLRAQLAEAFPLDAEVLGEAQLHRFAELAYERARAHGFVTAPDVGRYATLMVLLGSLFDEDPLLPWARAPLRDGGAAGASIRMQELHAAAMDVLHRTAGPDGAGYRRALTRARALPYERLVGARADPVRAHLRRTLEALHPEQYRVVAPALRPMLRRAARTARSCGLGCREGLVIVAALMFLLGCGFHDDPLHPWVAAALAGDAPPAEKARALHAAAMARLERYGYGSGGARS